MNDEKKIIYNGDDVTYVVVSGEISYVWNGVESSAVEKLRLEDHKKIINKIISFDADIKIMQKEKTKADKLIKTNEANKKTKKFVEEVKALNIIDEKKFEIIGTIFNANSYNLDNFKKFSLKSKDQKCPKGNLEFDDKIYSPNSYYPHTTSKPWSLHFNYKTVRYATLKKAIEKYVEKYNNLIIEKEAYLAGELREKNMEDNMQKFCENLGFTFEKVWIRNNHYTYTGTKPNVTIRLMYKDKTVKIESITLKKPTDDQFNEIVKMRGKIEKVN